MTRARRRQPHRQQRGPRATLPALPPDYFPPCGPNPWPEIDPGDPWAAHSRNLCACWHQYKDCCARTDHRESHPADTCPCTHGDTDAR